jgi:hypothetical protein
MGLTVLLAEDMPNFGSAIEWIKTKNHNAGKNYHWPIIRTFMPGGFRGDVITLMPFRRKREDADFPYAFFILGYGNEMFQVFLPTPERDQHIEGKKVAIDRFPCFLDFYPSQVGLPEVQQLDLTGTTVVRGDIVTTTMSFDARIPVDPTEGSANR